MAMTSNSGNGMASEINVTPLIDVLLVLLIIFMVIVPMVPKGLDAVVPQPANHNIERGDSDAIVVSVIQRTGSALSYRINQQQVSKLDLLPRLTSIFANRAERIMFVKGDDNVDFSQVAEVIDIGHAAGVVNVGLMTPKVLEGQ